MAAPNPPETTYPAIERDGITVIHDNGQSTIDIVLVHGLNGNPEKTWKHESGFFWPSKLSEHIPDARVMVFGYDADLKTSLSTSLVRIKDLGTAMLAKLGNFRRKKEESNRPLIFIGHSLGGLVMKQALLSASEEGKVRANSASRIYNSTRGLIFFSTPHLGSLARDQSLVKILKGIASVAFTEAPPKIVDALKAHSDELLDLSTFFRKTTLWIERRILIVSFYELSTDYRLGMPIVDQTSASMHYDLGEEVGIFANHQDMAKFKNEKNQDFATVCTKILEIQEFASESAPEGFGDPRIDVPSYPPIAMTPVKTFVQRKSLLYEIRRQLVRQPDGSKVPIKVGIWGLGGAGKSQLALSYMQQYRSKYHATFWIQAGEPASVDQNFLEIYRSIAFDTPQPPNPTAQFVRLSVLQFLIRKGCDLLVVFDGADHLHQRDKKFVDIHQYIPQSPNTHVIITSRSSIARELSTFEGIALEELEEGEAVDLFFNCARVESPGQEEKANVKEIVKLLGHLPLAISLAGSYVGETPRLSSNLPLYLEEYRQRRQNLWERQPHEIIHRYNHSVMTVWEGSYLAVHDRLPNACNILHLLSFLNGEDIYIDLFVLGLNVNSTKEETSWPSAIGMSADISIHDIESCLATLEMYSMIQRNAVDGSFKMHSLVHAWCRERLRLEGGQDINRVAPAALRLVYSAIKNTEEGRRLFEGETPPQLKEPTPTEMRMIPHLREAAQAVANLQNEASEDMEILTMLEWLGGFLITRWQFWEASQAWAIAALKAERCFGVDHPKKFLTRTMQAQSLMNLGKFTEAERVLTEATDGALQAALGEEHEVTIYLRNARARADSLRALLERSLKKITNLQRDISDLCTEIETRLEDRRRIRSSIQDMKQELEGFVHAISFNAHTPLGKHLISARNVIRLAEIRQEDLNLEIIHREDLRKRIKGSLTGPVSVLHRLLTSATSDDGMGRNDLVLIINEMAGLKVEAIAFSRESRPMFANFKNFEEACLDLADALSVDVYDSHGGLWRQKIKLLISKLKTSWTRNPRPG